MTIYECKKCKFITEIKTHYERHIKTKKHQMNTGVIEQSKSIPKISIKYHSSITEQPKNSILYECDYCDTCFKHINNKYRHQKYNCKARKTQEMMLQNLEEKHRLELEQRDKTIENLLDKLDTAIKKIGNTTNTTNNINNINNSKNLNITINAYGKEDIKYITKGEWFEMLLDPENSVVKLFLETHFNPEHPENANIRLRNRNSKFLEVHDGDSWKNKKKKKMLSEIADDKQGILDDKFTKDDDIQNELTETQRSGHSRFHDEVYYENKNEIMDEMEAVLLDNK